MKRSISSLSPQWYARQALWFAAATLVLCLAGCGSSKEFYRGVDESIARGDYHRAIENVRANRNLYGDKNSVLYNLDLGLLFHYAALTDSSNRHFFAAEREIDELYTKSVSTAVASFLLNDNVLPYEGEDFEKVLVNIFLALNYAEIGNEDDALVEARKVDQKLRQYAREYDGKNCYQEDAFIRYITGALYESAGELNDAFIAYRQSYESYKTYEKEYATSAPPFLLDDLVRTATLLSFDDEAETYKALGGKPFADKKNSQGTVLVVAYAGMGPVKEEVRTNVSVADTAGTIHTFQIALPKFVPRMKNARGYSVTAVQGSDSTLAGEATSVVAEDVTAISCKTLEDRLALIYLKSGGRALMKFLAAEKAKKELKKKDDQLTNILGSLAIDLVVGATEQADVRTWRTLPAEFQLAQLRLPPGDYTLQIRASDRGYRIPAEHITVRKGKTTFVIVDDIR